MNSHLAYISFPVNYDSDFKYTKGVFPIKSTNVLFFIGLRLLIIASTANTRVPTPIIAYLFIVFLFIGHHSSSVSYVI